MKRQYTPQQLEQLSLHVVERLWPLIGNARVVLAYYSLAGEVCTHRLIDLLAEEGRVMLLPKVISATGMELHRYYGKASLREGAFGIMEPVGEAWDDYELIDVALIPGMAFDADGHRLGRGRGYYDRLLPLLTRAKKIGVCFDFQKQWPVPVDAYDIGVDVVV